jgi:hypothetical protein
LEVNSFQVSELLTRFATRRASSWASRGRDHNLEISEKGLRSLS